MTESQIKGKTRTRRWMSREQEEEEQPEQNEASDKRRRWMVNTFVYVGEIMAENNNNNSKKHNNNNNNSEKRWFSMKRCGQMGPSLQRGAGGTDRCRCPNGGLLMTIMRVTSLNQVIWEEGLWPLLMWPHVGATCSRLVVFIIVESTALLALLAPMFIASVGLTNGLHLI